MGVDKNGYPTVGQRNGETIEGTSPDDHGTVSFEEPRDTEQLLEIADIQTTDDNMIQPLGELAGGVQEDELKPLKERVADRLPAEAELYEPSEHSSREDGVYVRAKSPRKTHEWDYLNGRRRAILGRLNDGRKPLDVVAEFGIPDSYVYRTRSTFGFLLDDPLLRETFIEEGGEYAPEYDPEETTETDEAADEEEETDSCFVKFTGKGKRAENPIDNGEEEEKPTLAELFGPKESEGADPVELGGKVQQEAEELVEAMEEAEEEEADDRGLFSGDEWWDVMKTLMDAGEDEYARRIAAEVDFG